MTVHSSPQDAHSPDVHTPAFKPRRAHEKSRNGCVRCKKQRKKCDEAKPRCSRCDIRGYTCEYAKDDSQGRSLSTRKKRSSIDNIDPRLAHLTIPTDTCSDISSQRSVSNVSVSPSPAYPHNPNRLGRPLCPANRHPESCTPKQTRYVLLLALSAVSKCHGLVKGDIGHQKTLADICELLEFAGDHHKASLRQIQVTMQSPAQYEYVLANAPLMVLYCSADHAVRVHLARTAKLCGVTLPEILLPAQSQWISLIRAAHAAYSGLMNSPSDPVEVGSASHLGTPTEIQEQRPLMASLCTSVDEYVPEDGPSEGTRRLLYPIIANTYRSALSKLQAKAMAICPSDLSDGLSVSETDGLYVWQQQSYTSCQADLDATLAALEILQDVADTVYCTIDGSSPDPQFLGGMAGAQVPPPLGRLRHVSPWLRSYSARVTSSTPTKSLRRTITAFLNRIPIEYLHFVQSILDLMPIEPSYSEPQIRIEQEQFPPSPVHKLAMDVFAHWLVFMVLLDGVWWIGGTGEWELERVVSFMRTYEWADVSMDAGERWWPESMSKVKRELAEHMREE
uniref:Zn(2)-C6 fungal-type domain-containing protein n=1 Tax=Bionectria ochroleuca TaxID=29856 RepID=A0A8H7K492_BIOOC